MKKRSDIIKLTLTKLNLDRLTSDLLKEENPQAVEKMFKKLGYKIVNCSSNQTSNLALLVPLVL